MTLPDPTKKRAIKRPDGTVINCIVHLNQVINHPRIEVGDFSYFSDFTKVPDENYAALIAPYLFRSSPEKLIIGKFCQFAHGVRFITSSANHNMDGFSTYPFFKGTVDHTNDELDISNSKGDTVVGNDVWIGTEAMIMPGVSIGNGAIIGARAVVAKDVPAYTVVCGNPAQTVKKRFDDQTIETLQNIKWWDWPVKKIQNNIDSILGADIEALKTVSSQKEL